MSEETIADVGKLPAKFGGDRIRHGKDCLKFVAGYLSPICSRYVLTWKSRSETVRRILSTLYRFWTFIAMRDYYGDSVNPDCTPFENLVLVYKEYVRRKPTMANNDLLCALEGLASEPRAGGTPFDSVADYNAPFELCLPEEMTLTLRGWFEELLAEDRTGIASAMTSVVGEAKTPGYVSTTAAFQKWILRYTQRKSHTKNKRKYWPLKMEGLPLTSGRIGFFSLCREVRAQKNRFPGEPLVVRRNGVPVEITKCIMPSAVAYFIQRYEAIIMNIVDVELRRLRWRRVAYLYDALIMKVPRVSGTVSMHVGGAMNAINKRIQKTMFQGVTVSSEILGAETDREGSAQPRKRKLIQDSDDSDVGSLEEEAHDNFFESSQPSEDEPPEKKRAKGMTKAEFRRKCIGLIESWAKKHDGWRERQHIAHGDGVIVYSVIPGTRVYTDQFRGDGEGHYCGMSVATFVNRALQEMDPEW